MHFEQVQDTYQYKGLTDRRNKKLEEECSPKRQEEGEKGLSHSQQPLQKEKNRRRLASKQNKSSQRDLVSRSPSIPRKKERGESVFMGVEIQNIPPLIKEDAFPGQKVPTRTL
jgi:hypothetical protein